MKCNRPNLIRYMKCNRPNTGNHNKRVTLRPPSILRGLKVLQYYHTAFQPDDERCCRFWRCACAAAAFAAGSGPSVEQAAWQRIEASWKVTYFWALVGRLLVEERLKTLLFEFACIDFSSSSSSSSCRVVVLLVVVVVGGRRGIEKHLYGLL